MFLSAVFTADADTSILHFLLQVSLLLDIEVYWSVLE